MANATATNTSDVLYTLNPSVYEIVAISTGSLALMLVLCIFCLQCAILCVVVRVKRLVTSRYRRESTSGGNFSDVAVELKKLTQLPNHDYTPLQPGDYIPPQAEGKVPQTKTNSASSIATPTNATASNDKLDPSLIRPIGEEEEEEEERSAIEELQRRTVIQSFLSKSTSKIPQMKKKLSFSDAQPQVKPKPKTSPPNKSKKQQEAAIDLTMTKTTVAATDDDLYDDITNTTAQAEARQSHSHPGALRSVSLISSIPEESKEELEADMASNSKKNEYATLIQSNREDNIELYTDTTRSWAASDNQSEENLYL